MDDQNQITQMTDKPAPKKNLFQAVVFLHNDGDDATQVPFHRKDIFLLARNISAASGKVRRAFGDQLVTAHEIRLLATNDADVLETEAIYGMMI